MDEKTYLKEMTKLNEGDFKHMSEYSLWVLKNKDHQTNDVKNFVILKLARMVYELVSYCNHHIQK